MKLTRPQRALLMEICERAQTISDTYPPAAALVALGLASWRPAKFGNGMLEPTEAGRALLALQENSNG